METLLPPEDVLITGAFIQPIPFTRCLGEAGQLQSMFGNLCAIACHHVCHCHCLIGKAAMIKTNLIIYSETTGGDQSFHNEKPPLHCSFGKICSGLQRESWLIHKCCQIIFIQQNVNKWPYSSKLDSKSGVPIPTSICACSKEMFAKQNVWEGWHHELKTSSPAQ